MISKKVGSLEFSQMTCWRLNPNPLNISVFGVPIVLGRSVVLRQIGFFFDFFLKRCLGKIDLSLNG